MTLFKDLLMANQELRSEISTLNSTIHEGDLEKRSLLTENQDLREQISALRTDLLIKDETLRNSRSDRVNKANPSLTFEHTAHSSLGLKQKKPNPVSRKPLGSRRPSASPSRLSRPAPQSAASPTRSTPDPRPTTRWTSLDRGLPRR